MLLTSQNKWRKSAELLHFFAMDSFVKLDGDMGQNLTVNQLVVGSIPTAGAKNLLEINGIKAALLSGLCHFGALMQQHCNIGVFLR